MRSLRSRLFLVWALSLVASLAVGAMMVRLYSRSSSIELDRAEEVVSGACDDVRDSYRYYGTGWNGPAAAPEDPAFRRDLNAVLAVALSAIDGVRGGIWSNDQGLLASFPPDAADLPSMQQWRPIAEQAAAGDRDVLAQQAASSAETVVMAACPLRGPVPGLVAWTSRRVASAAGLVQLRVGIGVLLILVVAIAAWLTWLVAAWSRHVRGIESALAGHAAGAATGALPQIAPTGERELDRIVSALNTASARLETAQQEAAAMAARVALSERLAALGRVAAGVAHEVRNPIATMRLRAENALAGPEARRGQALESILVQIGRLDRLLADLLAMTQATTPAPEDVDLGAFLAECARDQQEAAAARDVRIDVIGPEPPLIARFDAEMIRRAVANLVQNALRESTARGSVTLTGARDGGCVRIMVADTGPGVAAEMRGRLFEPFVTGHADGTGLGLSIARELVTAHGGTLSLAPSESGAVFVLELPCPSC